MALADYLPVNETLGVFVGISGYDWLSEGQADLLQAAIISLAAGALIGIIQQQRRKRRTK